MRPLALALLLLPVPAAALLDLDGAEWAAEELPHRSDGISDVRYMLVLVVHPLRTPSSLPVEAEDDLGTRLRADPPVIETTPGRDRYPVNLTWRPAEAGRREATVRAGGAEHRLVLQVDPVPPLLALSAGNATADWRLPVRIDHAAPIAEVAPSTVRGRWTDGNATLTWVEPGPTLPIRQEKTSSDVTIALRYGPGRYEFGVDVAGRLVRGSSPSITVEAAAASAPSGETVIVAVVPDAPLRLSLLADPVNDNGKLKRPGEDLITRIRVEDANGLAGLDRLTFEVLREETVVNVTRHVLPADRWARTSLDVENRFAASPLAAGPYRLRAVAWNGSAEAASVSRTFEIRPSRADAGELLLNGSREMTDRPWPVAGNATVASRGWERPQDAAGFVHLRAYRGSSQVALEGRLGNVTGSTPLKVPLPAGRHAILGERGAQTLSVAVVLPVATEGTVRIALLWGATEGEAPTSLASSSLEAVAPPRIARLEAAGPALPGQPLPIRIEVAGAWERTALRLGQAVAEVAPGTSWANLTVPPALPAGAPLAVEAEVHAAGRVAAARRLDLAVANAPPEGRLLPSLDGVPSAALRILPGAARELRVGIAAWDANGDAPQVLSLRLVRWDGATALETSPVAREGGAEGVLDLPADLAPGSYRLVARLRDAAGAEAEIAAPALVGGWAAVRADPTSLLATGAKLSGTLRVHNAGTVPLSALSVRVDGAGPLAHPATLRLGNASAPAGQPLPLPAALAPGAHLDLLVEIPLAPDAAPGRYEGRLRVLAVAEGAW